MSKIVTAINSKDWRALGIAADNLGKRSNVSIEELRAFLSALPEIVEVFTEQTILEKKGEQIAWRRSESIIWQIGESFRQVLRNNKELRKDRSLIKEFEQVSSDTRFGKGRESFVMLLGQYGDKQVLGTLRRLLDDPEVQGHSVYALRLLGAPEVEENIRPFLESRKTWVRNEAKKYFQKLEKHNL